MTSAAGLQPQKMHNNHESSDPTSDFIGFSDLRKQVHRKIAKRGFEFKLMLVGESGIGKKTFINNLFQTDQHPLQHVNTIQEKSHPSIRIETSNVEIEESGVKVRFTIINPVGYGDGLNTNDDYKIISDYIDNQFECYLNDECGLDRRNISDKRVHCLFYFISSLTRGLKPLDIKFMKALHHKVNIIPLIAKADALTSDELIQMKKHIIEQIQNNEIEIYQIPDCDSDEDEEIKEKNIKIKKSLPFAVISSTQTHEVKGKKVYGRLYPWGLVNIEESTYCDLIKLRTMLIIHMRDLQEVTHNIHYENYRLENIQLKRHLLHEEQQKRLIQEKDNELRRMKDMLAKMQTRLADT